MFFPSHRLTASLSRPGPASLALLYALDSIGRALTSTVLALHAYDLFKAVSQENADSLVGLTYTGISLCSLAGAFAAPWIIWRFGSGRAYQLAVIIFAAGLAIMATGTVFGLFTGLLGRALGGVLSSICIILFIVETIPKSDLVISETMRLFASSLTWGGGPVLGIFLYRYFGVAAVALFAISVHAVLLFYFRRIGFGASGREIARPANPLAIVKRFLAQRQLRLAWLIVFGRSAWWSMFFTYPALYLADYGLATTWAGWLTGAGNLLLAGSPLVRILAKRVGMKKPIVAAFWLGGLVTIASVFVYDSPVLVCLAILVGACFMVILDSLGNIPFMRFARPRERAQMTTVFRTYVDAAELVPSAAFALLLLFFDFRAVFIASGIITILIGLVATFLPRRL